VPLTALHTFLAVVVAAGLFEGTDSLTLVLSRLGGLGLWGRQYPLMQIIQA
jgi:hypothetical protein